MDEPAAPRQAGGRRSAPYLVVVQVGSEAVRALAPMVVSVMAGIQPPLVRAPAEAPSRLGALPVVAQ